MAQESFANKTLNLQIKKNPSVDDCEKYLTELNEAKKHPIEVLIPSHYEFGGLSELWSAMLVGTACRSNSNGTMRAAGLPTLPNNASLFDTLPGLTALQLSGILPASGDQCASAHAIFRRICGEQGGLLEVGSSSGKIADDPLAHSQTIIECDPLYRVARNYQSSPTEKNIYRFSEFLTGRRKVLEQNIAEKNLKPSDTDARDQLLRFLTELHTNSFEYSRQKDSSGSLLSGLRILRLAVHVARKDILLERLSGHETVSKYIDRVTNSNKKGFTGIMEASISDFGPGMLDHFLRSNRGLFYRKRDRAEVLQQLITTRLSSQHHESAGLGTQKAILAAQNIRALMSLRTAEFWVVKAFDTEASTSNYGFESDLSDVQGQDRAFVAGTHWQLLWPLVAI